MPKCGTSAIVVIVLLALNLEGVAVTYTGVGWLQNVLVWNTLSIAKEFLVMNTIVTPIFLI